MNVAYLCLAIGFLVVVAAGALVYVTTPTNAGWVRSFLGRLTRIRDVSVVQLGRAGAAVAVLLALSAAAVIITWPVGRFFRRFRPQIDGPILRWTMRHVNSTGTWHHVNFVVTHMGNRRQIQICAVVAAVIFAALWVRRGWWIPPVILGSAIVFEKFGQAALAKVVDRPPTGLPGFGTYPSGGCARTVILWGTVMYLILLTWPTISRLWRVAGFTVVALLAFVEGYTRIYLIKHWSMDVVGGWLFGTLLLLAIIGASSCFKPCRAAPAAT